MAGLPERYCAIDTETTGLYPYRGDYPFAAAASFPNGQVVFERDEFSYIRQICEDPTIDKVFHHAKFDVRMLRKKGIEPRGKWWDTGILCHLLDGRDAEGGLNLDDCTRKYLPAQHRKVVTELDDWFIAQGMVAKGKVKYGNFQQLPHDLLKRRNCGDAELTRLLFERLYPTVSRVFPYLLEMEHRLLPVVLRMEDRGVLVDPEEIQRQMEHFQAIIDDVCMFAEGVSGIEPFNLNSLDHQKELLKAAGIYELITEWTKPNKKRKSTKPFKPQRKMDAWNLQQLHHPVSAMMLVGKAAGKMISPFLTQALEYQVDGVLHANFKQTGTTSGRFSCAEPNLQNIPVEGDRKASYTEDEAAELVELTGHNFAPHIKRIFKVRDGYAHIHTDKKQAEMVVLAHYTKDPVMLDIFRRGEDIHNGITMMLFGEVTKGLKQRGKACTFGYQYGAGLPILARKMNGTLAEAKALKDKYSRIFSGLVKWKEDLCRQVYSKGYVETVHGRRHYLWKNEDYMAVNRVCQGTIGDEVKSRMIAIDDYIRSEGLDANIVLNIHDDLATELRQEDIPKHAPNVWRIMSEGSIEYEVPIPSSMDITYTRWSDLKEIKNPNDPSTYPQPPERVAVAA